MIYLYINILCIINTIQVQCDVTLQRTLGTELKITRHIESHVKQLATTIRNVDRVTDELIFSKWSTLDRGDYVSTPLTAMTMVRRLVQDWLPLAVTVGRYSKLSYLSLGEVRWPTAADLRGAARAVMRSQVTYDLSTTLMARGVQSDVYLTNVTAADYFEIARQYIQKERFPEAKEWLQHALARVRGTGDAPSWETVLYYLAAVLCFTGDSMSSINIIRDILKVNPVSKLPNDLNDYYSIMGTQGCVYPEKKIYSLLEKRYLRTGDDIYAVYFNRLKKLFKKHSRLCRGEVKTDSRLVCRYVHYQKPHLRFQPFKLEELQLDPPVVRFYDLVSDNESEKLITRAKRIMEPAHMGTDESDKRASEYRTSHVAWLRGENWLTRRISDATQLDAFCSEQHQVSRYSVSGEYLPHSDSFEGMIDWLKDRKATVMFYLNDVEQGGHTVFTKWKLSVPPVKNSAVMWFNLKPNGEGDESTLHSGCPVLKGRKWVLNKWIENGGNEFNYPCTLEEDGSFKGFYL